MKRLLMLILLASFSLITTYAQDSPSGINYQAVARDDQGIELAYKDIDVKFSIYQNSPGGILEWEEIQKTQTNKFGLFTLVIGQISHRTDGISKDLDSINWGSGPHYLKVDVDFGNGYVNMGTTQMMAVPYALYAKNTSVSATQITYNPDNHKLYANSKEVADFSSIGTGAVQSINLTGNFLTYSQNGQNYTIDLLKYLDNTDNQTLSLKGKILSISGGNSITLPDTIIQNLSLNNRILSITKGNSVTLPDQIQDLTWANDTVLQITNNPNASRINLRKFLNNQLTIGRNTLTICNGNSVIVNTDTTKQDLSISNDTILQITNNPNASHISLGKFLNNQLTTKRNTLSISNGNSVVINTDTTKQDLSISNDTLIITRNPVASKIGLKKYLDNTDNQTLTLSGNNLSISGINGGGNTIDVSNLVNTPWTGFSCSFSSPGTINIPANNEFLIPWIKDLDDHNDIINFKFKVPSSGVYIISLSFIFTNGSDNLDINIYNGDIKIKSFSSISSQSFSTSFLLKLNIDDLIGIKIGNRSLVSTYNLSLATFSGYRVH
jgi:hypothetical protein